MSFVIYSEDPVLNTRDILPFMESFGGKLPDVEICAVPRQKAGFSVARQGKHATITYSRRAEFFRGLGLLVEHGANPEYTVEQSARFRTDGAMIDCSRNGVLKEEAVYRLIRHMALMGLDTLMLYTEDTYEVPEQPYFGYMRGRYTQEELRRMDAYAAGFGVELVPCIQTLAHLQTVLHWPSMNGMQDKGDVLLAGDDKTYAFIEDMVRSCRKSLGTRRIHIGMDEAELLGCGSYRRQHGEESQMDVFCRHLKRVLEICSKYDFEPMLWSDMLFKMVGGGYYSGSAIPPEALERLPQGVKMVYWDYYQTSGEAYTRNILRHQQLPNPLVFAGGAWRWVGFAPRIRESLRMSRLALDACVKQGVSEVFVTAWGDNGCEGPAFSTLPVLQLFAEYCYSAGAVDDAVLDARLRACTGEPLERMELLDLPNETGSRQNFVGDNPCKYLLYQDVLCGLFDKHVGADYGKMYAEYADRLQAATAESRSFGYMYAMLAALCRVLALKADAGVRLKAAYDTGNREELRRIADTELPEIGCRVETFRAAMEADWMAENKVFGFEVQDQRLGGLESRLRTASRRIFSYLNGDTDRLEELEQTRLRFDGKMDEDPEDVCCNQWHEIVSASVM